MLVLFVLLVWGMLGIGSLVIDWGYVNLTRVQMQNVADAGAEEGLRLRDVAPEDPVASDLNRRVAVSQLAAWTYDDDFDLTDDLLQFGAGPDVFLTGGQTDLNAMQTVDVRSAPVYKPRLQWNDEANARHGDMVSGTFGIPDPGCSVEAPRRECANYTRIDFVPAEVNASPTADAFLVRLRRSMKPEPFQGQAGVDNVPGVSSAGPTLPLLLGLGSPLQAQIDSPGIRFTGVTVRATAIADARPVRGVGLPDILSEPPRLGVAPFGLARAAWRDSLVVDVPGSGTVDSSGVVAVGSTAIGRFLLPITSIGEPVLAQFPEGGQVTIDGYAPLYEDFLGTERVVGFARVEMTGTAPGSVQIIRRPGQVAVENATVTLLPAFPLLPKPELALLFQVNRDIQEEGALLAPALVR
ncbi:pilus assembly protein TadG-related protein [uncultured Nitrospira sp.]|uniref:pilus assembly protein TadG-related protein n=1 Tax=uncultured Nitrospira sp. TaxID=157176 RepID=UPI0031409545